MRQLGQIIFGATLALALSACSGGSSGGGPGAPCQNPNDCASGACLQVSCVGSGATPTVCGGAPCQASCVGDQVCVQVAGTGDAYCVPNSVCTGGGGNTDCDNACAYIYGTCQLTLVDTTGAQITEGECVQACANLGRVNMEACVQAAQCDENATVACFQ